MVVGFGSFRQVVQEFLRGVLYPGGNNTDKSGPLIG